MVGVPLKEQELLNAIFSGEFVNAAKRVFSNSQNSEVQKWRHYIKGDIKCQDYRKKISPVTPSCSRGKLFCSVGVQTESEGVHHRKTINIGTVTVFQSDILLFLVFFQCATMEIRGKAYR